MLYIYVVCMYALCSSSSVKNVSKKFWNFFVYDEGLEPQLFHLTYFSMFMPHHFHAPVRISNAVLFIKSAPTFLIYNYTVIRMLYMQWSCNLVLPNWIGLFLPPLLKILPLINAPLLENFTPQGIYHKHYGIRRTDLNLFICLFFGKKFLNILYNFTVKVLTSDYYLDVH